jgi:hypothetical protein
MSQEKLRRVTRYGVALHRTAANSNVMLTIGGISRRYSKSGDNKVTMMLGTVLTMGNVQYMDAFINNIKLR